MNLKPTTMTIEQVLRTDLFNEQDARTVERKHLNELLDKDRPAESLNVV